MNVRARDAVGNQTPMLTSHAFAVSASPKIVSATLREQGVWLGGMTVAVPEDAAQVSNQIVVRPDEFGLMDGDFVPVRLYDSDSAMPLGTIDYAAEELGFPVVFERAEVGFVLTLPTPLAKGESKEYFIQWGQLLHMGWQEPTTLAPPNTPAPPNIHSIHGTHLDANNRFWRLQWQQAYGHYPDAATGSAYLFVEIFDSSGELIKQDRVDFKPADYVPVFDPDDPTEVSYDGTNWTFPSMDGIVETDTEVWLFWRARKHTFDGMNYVQQSSFAFQRYNKSSLLPIGNPVYSDLAQNEDFSDPVAAPNGGIWLRGETGRGSAQRLIYSRINSTGSIIEHRVTLATLPGDRTNPSFEYGAKTIAGDDGKLWFFYKKRWDFSPTDDHGRYELYLKILNEDGTTFLPETRIGPPAAGPGLLESEVKLFNYRSPLLGRDGKVWVVYGANTSGELKYYSSIYNPDGTPFELDVPLTSERQIRFIDHDGYVWTWQDYQIQLYSPDGTVAEPARPPLLVPNQILGGRAARVEESSFRIFDRWSAQPVNVLRGSETSVGVMQVIDVDKFGYSSHVQNLEIAGPDGIIATLPDTLLPVSELDVSHVLSIGRNQLNFTQSGLLGGELLVAFEPDLTPPMVTGLIINGGEAQRSHVRSIALNFSESVRDTLDVADLTVENLTTGQIIDPDLMALDPLTGTWTFPGLVGSTLPNGDYRLSLTAHAIRDNGTNRLNRGNDIHDYSLFRLGGDLDGDADVDLSDLGTLSTYYGTTDRRGDCDGDGDVDLSDLGLLSTYYGSSLLRVQPEIDGELPPEQSGPGVSDGVHSIEFGSVMLHEGPVERTLIIRNEGSANLQITAPNLSASTAFRIVSLPDDANGDGLESIRPGATYRVVLAYDPQVAGSHRLTLPIASSDGNENPYIVELTGQAFDGPEISITDNSGISDDLGIALPATPVGRTSGTRTLFLHNTGDAPLLIDDFAIGGTSASEFEIVVKNSIGNVVTGSSFEVPAGELYFVDIRVRPTITGAHTAQITFNTNDPDDNEGTIVLSITEQAVLAGRVNYVGSVLADDDALSGLRNAQAVAISPDGLHLYVTAVEENAVNVFLRNPVEGTVTLLQKLRDGQADGNGQVVTGIASPFGATLSPDGRYLYVTGRNAGAVGVFARDTATGMLTFVEALRQGQTDGHGSIIDGLSGSYRSALSPDGFNLYVTGQFSDAVAVFNRNSTTGRLTFLEVLKDGSVDGQGNSINELERPRWVRVSQDGRHVYVASGNDSAITVFNRNSSTGHLTVNQVLKDGQSDGFGNLIDGLETVVAISLSPDGRHLYATSEIDDALTVFSRDELTGKLQFVEMLKQGQTDSQGNLIAGLDVGWALEVEPEGAFVYVTGLNENALSVFYRDTTTGRLTYEQTLYDGQPDAKGNVVDGLGNPRDVAVSPDGVFVYSAGFIDSSVAIFGRELLIPEIDVELPPEQSQPIISDDVRNVHFGPSEVGVPAERTLLIRNEGNAPLSINVTGLVGSSVFQITGYPDDPESDGIATLLPGTTYRVSIRFTAEDFTSRSAQLTIDSNDPNEAQFVVNLEGSGQVPSGRLNYVGGLVDGQVDSMGNVVDGLAGAQSVVTSPDGRHVYVTGRDDHSLVVFDRNSETGQLTWLQTLTNGQMDGQGHTIAGLTGAFGMTISPDGEHLYVTSRPAQAVTAFDRDPLTGLLTYVETLADGQQDSQGNTITGLYEAYSATVSPDGNQVYVAGQLANAVVVFGRNSSTGRLTFVETLVDGQVDGQGNTITSLSRPRSIQISSDGHHVYVAAQYDSAITVFNRDTTTGRLTVAQVLRDGQSDGHGNLIDGLDTVVHITLSPDGRQLYSTSEVDDAVAVFSRDETTGRLRFIEMLKQSQTDNQGNTIAGLDVAWAVTMSPDGYHLYVTGLNENALTVFRRDLHTGQLMYEQTLYDGQPDAGGNTINGLSNPMGLTMSPDGAFVYATGYLDNAVAVFRREAINVIQTTTTLPPLQTKRLDVRANRTFKRTVATIAIPGFKPKGYSAKIFWGDGKKSLGRFVLNAKTGDWEIVGDHKYKKRGLYTLRVEISKLEELILSSWSQARVSGV